MERRQFLRLLGIAPVAAVAAKYGIEPASPEYNWTQAFEPVEFTMPNFIDDLYAMTPKDTPFLSMIGTKVHNDDIYAKIIGDRQLTRHLDKSTFPPTEHVSVDWIWDDTYER